MPTELTDNQALAEFVKSGSTEAFSAIARRHSDLVFSVARRLTNDAHLAEDITQAVFIVLARRASSINPACLAGWLVGAARLASRDAVRCRYRRQKRETEAAKMRREIQTAEEPSSDPISIHLDDALARLGKIDRSSVVLRFMQGRSFVEVGVALGVSEEAARKRVTRALEKLRVGFRKEGIAPSVAGVAAALVANRAKAAPTALVGNVISNVSSMPTGAPTAIAIGLVWGMNIAKAKVATVTILILLLLAAGGTTAFVHAQHVVASAPAATLPTSQPAKAEHKIEPGDRLRITFHDVVGLNQTTVLQKRVDPSGRISVIWIPQVRAGGNTPSEVATAIDESFHIGMLVPHANTRVQVIDHGPSVSFPPGPFKAGDHFVLRVWFHDPDVSPSEISQMGVLDANGTMQPAQLEPVKIGGLTEYEAEKAINNAYKPAGIATDVNSSIERISTEEYNRLTSR